VRDTSLQFRFTRPAIFEVDVVLPIDVGGIIAKDPGAVLDDLLAFVIPSIVNNEFFIRNVFGL
jgi:hypothetical protein